MRLSKGDVFPFSFETRFGEMEVSSKESLTFPAVIWFHRYVGCPLCLLEMSEINKKKKVFSEKGYMVYVILQSNADKVKNLLGKIPLSFPIISDPERRLYKLCGVAAATSSESMLGGHKEEADEKIRKAISMGFMPGDPDGNELQLPAVFVVDADGVISFVHYADYLVDIPSVGEILDLLP